MAVDQHGLAKLGVGAFDQIAQGAVIGVPTAGNPRLGLGQGELAAIDGAASGHHAGNHPKSRGDARVVRRAGDAVDHGGIKFIGRAVEVEIGARHMGGQQGRAVPGC